MINSVDKTLISEALDFIGIVRSQWNLLIDEATGEGHTYTVNENYYEEVSNIVAVHNESDERLELWIDIAWVPGMNVPIAFVASIHPKDLALSHISDITLLNPNHQLHSRLGEERFTKLFEEEHFAQDTHMLLFKKNYDSSSGEISNS